MNKPSTSTILQKGLKSPEMKWVEKVSHLLDSKYVIPGTSIRFGLDPILSLVPVAGDLVTYLISGVLIYTMYRNGASRKVVIKMLLNSSLDTLIGSIPLVGTVFDVFYRSNERNIRLLREHYHEGKHQGPGTGLVVAIVVIVLFFAVASLFGIGVLAGYLIDLMRG